MSFLFNIQPDMTMISAIEATRGLMHLIVGITIALIIGMLIIRFLTDALKMSPFGRVYQSVRRPTDELYRRMRTSNIYYPLRRSLGFDPTVIMILFALAISWYVIYLVSDYLFQIVLGMGASLTSFVRGEVFSGARILIGTILLGVIFFLMTMMTIVFVNWLFGLMRRSAYWSMERLAPLLKIFEFGGVLAGFSFIILWIALVFAARAVTAIFF
jgi:hypothetical protein